jgi:predicted ATPase
VLDDLHQENVQALDLHKYVLSQITQAKLVILVTYEPITTLDLEIQTLVVPDLSRDETNLIAMAILHASELGPRLGGLLWERTSGRPLFVESLLRTLLEEEYIEDVNGRAELKHDADVDALPENVRELVVSRIDRLPLELKHLLNVAAVLGEDFTAEELDAVSEPADLEDINAALPELLKLQLLTEREKGVYSFRHGMTEAVIYETLSRAQRLKFHRLAVNYWRGQTGENARPITLAYHLLKCGQLPQAIEIVTQAAEEAEQRQDIEGAVELYTHALTIFPDEKSIQTQLERLRQLQGGG